MFSLETEEFCFQAYPHGSPEKHKIHQQFQEKLKPANKVTFKNCSQHVLQQVKSHNGHLKGTSSSDLQLEHWNLPRRERKGWGKRRKEKEREEMTKFQ